MSVQKQSEVQALTHALLGALDKKPAQTVTELKAVVDRRFRGRVPLTYICIGLCRLVNDGYVVLKDGRCSRTHRPLRERRSSDAKRIC